MSESTALAVRDRYDLSAIQTWGQTMATAGFFRDAKEAAKAMVIIQYGLEMGVEPAHAMMSINVIEGKPAPAAALLGAKIKQSDKYDYRIVKLDDTGCLIDFFEKRDGKFEAVGQSSFSLEDAQRAGLLRKDNFAKYPRNMYLARALSNGAKWYTPDVFLGPVYAAEELQENARLGITIDGELQTPSDGADAGAGKKTTTDKLRERAQTALPPDAPPGGDAPKAEPKGELTPAASASEPENKAAAPAAEPCCDGVAPYHATTCKNYDMRTGPAPDKGDAGAPSDDDLRADITQILRTAKPAYSKPRALALFSSKADNKPIKSIEELTHSQLVAVLDHLKEKLLAEMT